MNRKKRTILKDTIIKIELRISDDFWGIRVYTIIITQLIYLFMRLRLKHCNLSSIREKSE